MLWLFFLLLMALFVPPNSYGSNSAQGVKAAAMGTTVVAIADDPSAIAHNLAELVNLRGTHFYNGMTALTIKSIFENPRGQSERTQF